jgi:hypothetical protein
MSKYEKRVPDDWPFWYGERSLVGFLAAAIWASGGVCIEEYQADRKADAPEGTDGTYLGRGDLYFRQGDRQGNIEFKMHNIGISRTHHFPEFLTTKWERSKEDAQTVRRLPGTDRFGGMFLRPYVGNDPGIGLYKGNLKLLLELAWDTVKPDVLAWWCPVNRVMATDEPSKKDWVVGVILLVKQVKSPSKVTKKDRVLVAEMLAEVERELDIYEEALVEALVSELSGEPPYPDLPEDPEPGSGANANPYHGPAGSSKAGKAAKKLGSVGGSPKGGKPKLRREDAMTPAIYSFPHSSEEFSSAEELADYLRETLIDNDGRYRLVTASRYTSPRSGDIVLFQKNRRFVGEARIKEGLRHYERPELVAGHKYQGYLTFDPDTVRVYEKTTTFDELEERSGMKLNQQAVQRIDSKAYKAITGAT